MKKLFVLFVLLSVCKIAFALNPSYQQKLYYTCKVWGFVKYYHSKVSVCEVNWDSVLLSNLPLIKNAVTNNDFNDALYQILQAAGPMAIAITPLPDTLQTELKRNKNFGWINDPVFRNDIKVILDTIKKNFRPHPSCWVIKNDGSGNGWLVYPHDDPIFSNNLYTNFPDEFSRLMIIFKYWNILNYFNPYNYILDTPWDSTLYNNVQSVASASNYWDFFITFKKIAANLNDAHVEVLTSSFFASYSPKIVLRYSHANYIVVKSDYSQIKKGDVILSIDGKTTTQWEDSLRPYISAGNPSVFRSFVCNTLLLGASGSLIRIEFQDSLGNANTITTYRYNYFDQAWFTYYPNDTLSTMKWEKWDCNVSYVHLGNLVPSDVSAMVSALKNSKAIIFDVRNYPNATAWPIANLLYPDKICYAKLTEPDVTYPGTFFWFNSYLGTDGNPSNYKGKLIILCNQESISQAEYSCMILKAMPNSVIVGSQTAGTDGEITIFKLSQDIQAGFTSLGVFYPDGTETQRIGIVPDSIVYLTAQGIRQGRDEVLEKALQIAGCDTATGVKEFFPTKSELNIYPNPASDNISISFYDAKSSDITISIFNSLGTEVKYFNENQLIGGNSIYFSTESLPTGVYYCTLNNGIDKITRRFVVVK